MGQRFTSFITEKVCDTKSFYAFPVCLVIAGNYLFDVFDYCLIDWNDQVQDRKGKKVKCTREAKRILFDSDKDAWKWISYNAATDLNFGDDAQVKKKLLERFSGVLGSNGDQTIGEPAAANA